MIILVINSGSSSIKYKLFEVAHRRVMASGLAEKIGESNSILTHVYTTAAGEEKKHMEESRITDHHQGLQRIVDLLMDPQTGVIGNRSEITAIGHRVVHGGDSFQATTLIDDQVIADIQACIPLAPLHNPANLMGIQVARKIFPDAVQAAVFDTAFHQSLPVEAYLYAIPFEFYEKYKIRRYGFHGTSHAFVAEEAAAFLKRPLAELNLITLHLGNGASMAAIKGGRCVDTTMGLTPLAGLVMGTRSGDLDPSILRFLADHEGLTPKAVDELLNKKSGLLGLCGDNDMRQVIQKTGGRRPPVGDSPGSIHLSHQTLYRGLRCLPGPRGCPGLHGRDRRERPGGSRALLPGSAGPPASRSTAIRNRERADERREISAADSRVKILVVPTNEELRIAQETRGLLHGKPEKV